MYREDKATAMAVYFLEKTHDHKLNDLVLMKLMVIAERQAMRDITARITGAQFASMKNGPVLSEVLNSMRHPFPGQFWGEHIRFVPFAGPGTASNHCKLESGLNVEDYLSEYEIELLTNVWKEHGSKHKWDIVDLTHTFPEWHKPNRGSTPITYESIFRDGFSESPEVARKKAREVDYFESVAC